MLPILRIIPVGGVLLAIAILGLALKPPVGPHARLTGVMMPAQGALIAREHHPEWRQFLILAALRRADALRKLRDLPDTPTRTAPLVRSEVMQPEQPATAKAPDEPQVAGVHPSNTDQGDITGTVASPDAAIPVDIGESSSTELPVVPHEQQPPVIMMPAREIPPPDKETQPAPKPQGEAAPEPVAPAPAATEQATHEHVAPALAAPAKPEADTALPAESKQASREPAPQPVAPKAESKAAAPVESKQASREPTPQPVAPNAESKAAAPAEPIHASREPAPLPAAPEPEDKAAAPAEPKLAIREVVLPPEKPTRAAPHVVVHRRPNRHVVHHARRYARKQDPVQFDLFRALFGIPFNKPIPPNRRTWRVPPTAR
jgi:hypothetical protein